MINIEAYQQLKTECDKSSVTLVAVSKTKPVEDIMELYNLGHHDFGENYVQELVGKQEALPQDIRWHFMGHLQTNKVKQIVPFVYLIHSVDSEKLLKEIDKQAGKINRSVGCLLQMHIAQEETKFGMDEAELAAVMNQIESNGYPQIAIHGLMGMASFTDDVAKVTNEFRQLKRMYDQYVVSSSKAHQPTILSMGMSGDYQSAIREGSTMVRIGSMLFGARK
jgi:PLP dependent protein